MDGWMDGWTDGRTDGRTDAFSLARYVLHCYVKNKIESPLRLKILRI